MTVRDDIKLWMRNRNEPVSATELHEGTTTRHTPERLDWYMQQMVKEGDLELFQTCKGVGHSKYILRKHRYPAYTLKKATIPQENPGTTTDLVLNLWNKNVRSPTDIANFLSLTKATVIYHLEKLNKLGTIEYEKNEKHNCRGKRDTVKHKEAPMTPPPPEEIPDEKPAEPEPKQALHPALAELKALKQTQESERHQIDDLQLKLETLHVVGSHYIERAPAVANVITQIIQDLRAMAET